jgi:hypothetical protein
MFSWLLVRDENLFSSNMSNGASKNSFHTGFKNVYLKIVKSAPKKMESKNYFANLKFARSRRKFGFVGKFDLGALFTKVKCTFLKSV